MDRKELMERVTANFRRFAEQLTDDELSRLVESAASHQAGLNFARSVEASASGGVQ